MQRHPRYTRDRIAQVGERIRALIHADARDPGSLRVAGPVDRVSPEEAERLDYRDAELGERFGPLWATYWFRVEATVPEEWAGERVDLLWVSHSEATLWIGARPVQGLNSSPQGARIDAPVLEPAAGGERLDLRVEMACNGKFGALSRPYASLEPVVLDRCRIARFDRRAWDLHHDFDVLRRLEADAGSGLDESWAGKLLSELNRFCNLWVEDDRATWDEAEAILKSLLANRNGSHVHEISAIGHAPHRHGVALAAGRDAAQAGAHLQLPDGVHGPLPGVPVRVLAGPAVRLDPRRGIPTSTSASSRHAEAGRWVPVGGTWVEPDCNLPSGESLVRQFLHGQRFFERELGRRCREFWNPDVFGYNGQLPQIMRGAGIGRFLTQKLSWNRFNAPPHHTFTWQGIDGSEVLAHFPPADTYNATAEVEELRRSARDYKDHDRSGRSLLLFGYGDGGGGPTPEMLETLRRVRDLQGVPRTTMASSDEFFAALEAEAADLPTIVGELYFEYHRGTYTTQAAVKRGNREGERALHDAELLAALAARGWSGAEHPGGRLAELWQLLLLNQFHDILPGSSIALVYEDAARDHAEVRAGADAVAEAGAGGARRRRRTGATPFNTIGFARAEVADRVRTAGSRGSRRRPTGSAPVGDRAGRGLGRRGGRRDRARERPPARGARAATAWCARSSSSEPGARRSPRPGTCSRSTTTTRPRSTPGTSTRSTSRRSPTARPATSCEVAASGPLRAEVVVRAAGRPGEHHAAGRATRRRRPAARVPLRGRLARVAHDAEGALPGGRVRSPNATYQMQFGHAERPTHYSTSHDLARYEVPGPPVRRSLRARLRRRAPHRLQVRLLDLRERDADQPAALRRPSPTPPPTSAGTSSHTP